GLLTLGPSVSMALGQMIKEGESCVKEYLDREVVQICEDFLAQGALPQEFQKLPNQGGVFQMVFYPERLRFVPFLITATSPLPPLHLSVILSW
ncbi:MAG: hypothetical protein ACLPQL_11385, partial [Desulfobaccales bacterium]